MFNDVAKPSLLALDDELQAIRDLAQPFLPTDTIDVVQEVDGIAWNLKPAEFIESVVEASSPLGMVTGVTRTLTSIVVPAGKWEITGLVGYTGIGAVNLDVVGQGASVTAATLPATYGDYTVNYVRGLLTLRPAYLIAPRRVLFTVETTVYLVTQATFTGGTQLLVWGWIRASRLPQ